MGLTNVHQFDAHLCRAHKLLIQVRYGIMVSETITITIKQTGYFTMVAWLVLVSGDKTSRVVVSLFFLFSSFQDEERGGNNKETGCPVSSTKVNHATRVTTLFLQ